MSEPSPLALAVILAGGASRRFGADKALARVAGVRVLDRLRAAVEGAGLAPARIVADRPERFAGMGLEVRAERIAGRGPLGGLECALEWACELSSPGALLLACDLPFVPAALLRELARPTDAAARVPESEGRRGFEPLCAWYATSLIPAVRTALQGGGRSLAALLASIAVERLPLARVRELGAPGEIFFNLNTRGDLAQAEALAARSHAA